MINWGSRWAVVAGLAGATTLAGAVVPPEADAWTAPVALQAAQGATPGAQDAPGRIIFRGPTVIDGTGAPAREEMAIVVEGERIEAIVPVAELTDELLADAEVVDATGWFAIPGLVESHTHVATMASRERAGFILNRYLYAGITTARDMAGDVRSLMDLQRASSGEGDRRPGL